MRFTLLLSDESDVWWKKTFISVGYFLPSYAQAHVRYCCPWCTSYFYLFISNLIEQLLACWTSGMYFALPVPTLRRILIQRNKVNKGIYAPTYLDVMIFTATPVIPICRRPYFVVYLFYHITCFFQDSRQFELKKTCNNAAKRCLKS